MVQKLNNKNNKKLKLYNTYFKFLTCLLTYFKVFIFMMKFGVHYANCLKCALTLIGLEALGFLYLRQRRAHVDMQINIDSVKEI